MQLDFKSHDLYMRNHERIPNELQKSVTFIGQKNRPIVRVLLPARGTLRHSKCFPRSLKRVCFSLWVRCLNQNMFWFEGINNFQSLNALCVSARSDVWTTKIIFSKFEKLHLTNTWACLPEARGLSIGSDSNSQQSEILQTGFDQLQHVFCSWFDTGKKCKEDGVNALTFMHGHTL